MFPSQNSEAYLAEGSSCRSKTAVESKGKAFPELLQ